MLVHSFLSLLEYLLGLLPPLGMSVSCFFPFCFSICSQGVNTNDSISSKWSYQRHGFVLVQDKIEKAKEERTAAAVASRPRPPSPADFAAYMASLQMDEIPTSSDFEGMLVCT